MPAFELVSDFEPRGDQPEAVEALVRGLSAGKRHQTLLGVTGSGKTFTIANVIQACQRPTLVISHNKTLAAQLYHEFRTFFPRNAVEYFVSYYDYYQPEAYIPRTDTYIEKSTEINDEIDRLRLSTTSSLMERDDVIVVASVSCIFGLGSPESIRELVLLVERGARADRQDILMRLVELQYDRNDYDLGRGTFRVRGDVIEIFPAYSETAVRIEMFGDEVERICDISPVTGAPLADKDRAAVYPASHFATTEDRIEAAIESIEAELEQRVAHFNRNDKLLEAQRISSRTRYDVEALREFGYCQGIENYSRHIDGRAPGQPPGTLIDYFARDFLLVIDESHVTLSQIRAMYNGDRSRKATLIQHGFRLPSALDNRPLKFEEFEAKVDRVIYVSATPGEYELQHSGPPVEQIIRPTGLVDPGITVKPVEGQVDDLIERIRERAAKSQRVLVTTLTIRMAEDLTDYLQSMGIRVRYLHAHVDTLERVEILRDLRLGKFDCLVGINLLREGLDLPEVSLVAVLDADKEGFLRSQTSLIQVAGRTARNVDGEVIMYADVVTGSMQRAMDETERRRQRQLEYNREHGVTPKSVEKAVADLIDLHREAEETAESVVRRGRLSEGAELEVRIAELESRMYEAAAEMEFERAAALRDELAQVKKAAGVPEKPRWA